MMQQSEMEGFVMGPARAPVRTVLVVAAMATSLLSCGSTSDPQPARLPSSPLSGSAPAESSSAYAAPVLAGRIEMADIEESSGLSASECQDVLWTHNDAGNPALIYGMSTAGKHLGTWQVEGAENIDWESIATYKDPAGACFLIIGDIGDNDEARDELDVYRIPEPTASIETAGSDSARPLLTDAAQSMRFSYPDGNNNAETILVQPKTGDIYVVTKKESGPAAVFRIKPAFGAGTAVISEKVADISVPSEPEGRLTGGSMSPDGDRVMLCDLNAGYEFVLPEGVADPDAIWQQQPLTVDLGDRPQGEGVSYGRDGRTLFASSEEQNSPLFVIRRR